MLTRVTAGNCGLALTFATFALLGPLIGTGRAVEFSVCTALSVLILPPAYGLLAIRPPPARFNGFGSILFVLFFAASADRR